MTPEQMRQIALEKHKANADDMYEYIIRQIKEKAENGEFSYLQPAIDGYNSSFGYLNKDEIERITSQIEQLGFKVKYENERISISW